MSSVSDWSDGVFALLDDACSTAAEARRRRSRLYGAPVRTLVYRTGDDLGMFFAALESALAEGLHAVGLFSFELGHALQRLPDTLAAGTPLATVALFERCEQLTMQQVDAWLAQRAKDRPYAVTQCQPALDEADFTAAVDQIRHRIACGDTYQVNFTFPLHFDMHGDPLALYAALRARQPVPYGALLGLPDGQTVLSLSPELFVSHVQGLLQCRPMKGTAAATGDAATDAALAQALRDSDKERAGNLMIVDLLRNDLGRIAETGSVTVPELFAVERFGAVLQMTSTIDARARNDIGLRQLFDALFPCGSVTGAPKRRTLQILQQLERWPRRLYSGAIGWFAPATQGRRLGDFMLSVPIRTLQLDAPDANDRRRGELGVGAGIVYDSDARAEYQECLLKAGFLTGAVPGFGLFETMHATRAGCRLLEPHLARLSASAGVLGFVFDEAALRQEIAAVCTDFEEGREYRLRVALHAGGGTQLTSAPVTPLSQPVRLLLSPLRMPAYDPLLAHKTTLRRAYDDGWQQAEAAGAFDTLFFNERGELTEGGRSNVFVRIGGRWMTPPLSSGLLPGVMRAQLLADPGWDAREQCLTREDLRRADEICVCNALRGTLRAVIDWEA
jgi:para-aminobenzoate synthetase/4-amino-4-deoxychorismate lyase